MKSEGAYTIHTFEIIIVAFIYRNVAKPMWKIK